jgi:hypothetical protein
MKVATPPLRIKRPAKRSDSLNLSLSNENKNDINDILRNFDEDSTAIRLNTSEGIWDLL